MDEEDRLKISLAQITQIHNYVMKHNLFNVLKSQALNGNRHVSVVLIQEE